MSSGGMTTEPTRPMTVVHSHSSKAHRSDGRAGVISPSESIDTTSAGGRLAFQIMAALAEFERIQADLTAAKSRGAKLGSKRKLNRRQIEQVRALLISSEKIMLLPNRSG